jgi:histidyl-tRNA synthetase
MAKVWRGEKPQAGRYREFVQCDFDIVGSESISSDFEILLLMKSAFDALGVPGVTIRLNHRGVFNSFLARILGDSNVVGSGIGDDHNAEEVLRTIDKLSKIGMMETRRLLTELTGSAAKSDEIISFATAESTFDATLDKMRRLAGPSPEAAAGIERLKGLQGMIQALGLQDTCVLDPAITRGLDYYTGLVYETFLDDAPEMGSVCSGGRYDNLAGLYMKERLPGVGSSIGLDRLMAALDTLGASGRGAKTGLDVLVLCLDASLYTHYHRLAAALRAQGLSAEVFAEAKKAGQQYQAAEKKGTRYALLCTAEEAAKGVVTVKNLADRNVREGLTIAEAIGIIKSK